MDEFNNFNKNKYDMETNEEDESVNPSNANNIAERNIITGYKKDAEAASEIAGFDDEIELVDKDDPMANQVTSIPGWIGLTLAVISFFIMPIILGGAAIIIGFIARTHDANWLGNTAIALGVISIITRLFFIPFV